MIPLETTRVDWWDEVACDEWRLTCPFCDGETVVEAKRYECLDCGYTDWIDDETCPNCGGDNTDWYWDNVPCDECGGTGKLEPITYTAWYIPHNHVSREVQQEVASQTACIVVFRESDKSYWLALGGCGMDMTPHLAAAWLILGFDELPLDWVRDLAGKDDDWIELYLAGGWAARIRSAMYLTVENELDRLQGLRARLEYGAKKTEDCRSGK